MATPTPSRPSTLSHDPDSPIIATPATGSISTHSFNPDEDADTGAHLPIDDYDGYAPDHHSTTSGVSSDTESDFGDEGGASVPLQRLSLKKRKPRPGMLVGIDGGRGTRSVYDAEGAGGEVENELVVRWSGDGGSPTSFRKLRENHKKGLGREYRRGGGGGGGAGRGYEGGGGSGTGGLEELLYTPEEERRVVRKMDRNLVFFLAGLYMLSFLDRSSEFSTAAADVYDRRLGSEADGGCGWGVCRYWECKDAAVEEPTFREQLHDSWPMIPVLMGSWWVDYRPE